MKQYNETIALAKNKRGCYILDTVKGCEHGLQACNKGCYGECYAKKIADRYGYDFSKVIQRKFNETNRQFFLFGFKDETHLSKIRKEIKKCDSPFIRIGEMGDPSEDWDHTIQVCKKIYDVGKTIVIVTKHWKELTDEMIYQLTPMGICINTSISALDTPDQISYRLNQFYRLKNRVRSILRIVSCDFNEDNNEGWSRARVQEELFKHTPNIDTIFRPSKRNSFVLNEVINVTEERFLGKKILVSRANKRTFFGTCSDCEQKCGLFI